uniref:DUF6598 domain-containing protein n=1 Tax=Leersia perrieri TaxID=77586 RepID=A0A0D9XXC9_9ORYZ
MSYTPLDDTYRDNWDSFLELQGPSRAIVLIDPAIFEVDLKVKSDDEQTNDKPLASLVFYHDNTPYRDESHLETLTELTEHSTMEFKFAEIINAVEATIQVRVIQGSRDFRARFFIRTACIDEDFVLLNSKDRNVIIADDDDGLILFQRSVAVVEERGQLILGVDAVHEVEKDGGATATPVTMEYPFTPRTALRSKGGLTLDFARWILQLHGRCFRSFVHG